MGSGPGRVRPDESRLASEQSPLGSLTALAYAYWNLLGIQRGGGRGGRGGDQGQVSERVSHRAFLLGFSPVWGSVYNCFMQVRRPGQARGLQNLRQASASGNFAGPGAGTMWHSSTA